MTGSQLSVVLAASFDEVREHRAAWNALAEKARWPFAEFDWQQCSSVVLDREASPRLLLVVERGVARAAIALTRSAGTRWRRYVPAGYTSLFEATGVLVGSGEARSELVRALLETGEPMMLPRVLSASALVNDIKTRARRRACVIARPAAGVPYLDLPSDPGAIERSLSRSRRSDIRRKLKRLQGLGHIAFVSSHPGEDMVDSDLADFESLEHSGWKGRQGSSIIARRSFHEFFSASLRAFSRDHGVRIDRMTLDGKTIGIQFGLVRYGAYYLIKPTYDERFSAYSPGLQLTHYAILQSVRDGLRRYEFLGSTDPWKLQWTSAVHPTVSLAIYPYRARGMLCLANDVLGSVTRRRH